MAPAKKKPNGKQKSKPAAKRKQRADPSSDASLVAGHLNMLVDPCAAELKTSVYRGRGGYMMRLSTVAAIDAAAGQAGIAAWHPGAANVSYKNGVTPSTPFTATWGATSGSMIAPVGVLPTIASGVRCVAACMTVTYVGAELNRGGMVCATVGPAGEVLLPTPTTVNEKFDLATATERSPSGSFEIKWAPSPMDEEYVDINGAPSDYFNDRTALLLGFIAGDTPLFFRVRMTAIYEYLPRAGKNVPLPPAVNRTVPGGLEKLVNAASKIEHFVTNVSHAAAGAYGAYRAMKNSTSFKIASATLPFSLCEHSIKLSTNVIR